MSAVTCGKKGTRVPHNYHSYRNVSDAHSVVNKASRFSLSVPFLDICGSYFQLQRRCDAVTRLKAIRFRRLSVCMKIDEARRDDEAGGVDGGAARKRLSRNRGDAPAA